jgi:hypothetical protein
MYAYSFSCKNNKFSLGVIKEVEPTKIVSLLFDKAFVPYDGAILYDSQPDNAEWDGRCLIASQESEVKDIFSTMGHKEFRSITSQLVLVKF